MEGADDDERSESHEDADGGIGNQTRARRVGGQGTKLIFPVRRFVLLLVVAHLNYPFQHNTTNARPPARRAVVGYPNVGKSSVINTLISKKSCKVAPVPGETKIWQYISLMKRIFLIDCPGVVVDR